MKGKNLRVHQRTSGNGRGSFPWGCCVAFCNIALLLLALYFFVSSRENLERAADWLEKAQMLAEHAATTRDSQSQSIPQSATQIVLESTMKRQSQQPLSPVLPLLVSSPTTSKSAVGALTDISCTDPVWCNIEMPSKSFYKFDTPPTDARRWKIAQAQAASGEQVLLKRVSKVFPAPWNTFLDGDKSFRGLHSMVDIFVDSKADLNSLLPGSGSSSIQRQHRRRLEEETIDRSLPNPIISPDSKLRKFQVVPPPYDYREAERAPIIQLGYAAFKKDGGTFFKGNFVTFVGGPDQPVFLQAWNDIKHKLDVPFITMVALNENWGWLATMYPNRTAKWGRCCDQPKHKLLHEFLDHPKTLMVVIGQHSNISHPKVLTIPRGLPLNWRHTEQMVWDSLRTVQQTVKKTKLLFASASSWGPRPQILRCVSAKMSPDDFEGHDQTPKTEMDKTRQDRKRYYEKIAGARMGLCLPGLGYDTFRLWEMLTMGTVVVLERAVGFDRTLWRLPALLVDDFYDITPDLLRAAYVEALYRADEFEFERLTQRFWFTVIANVSASMSIQPLLDKFPMKAEEPNFARPRDPYPCGITGTCGKGTKRIPKQSC